jgi:hypothetical protein
MPVIGNNMNIHRSRTMSADSHIEHASKLPLIDAAYYLWIKRFEVIDESRIKPDPSLNLKDPAVLQQVFQKAIAHVQDEDPTLRRLRAAHPDSDDSSLKQAVSAAVKFEQDYLKKFSYDNPDPYQLAIDFAKQENPDFQEGTYELAMGTLMFEMR